MSLLNILHYPDVRLRKIAKLVTKVNLEIQNIIKDMFETMYKRSGIGLAATQVNIHKQIIVIDIEENNFSKLVLINPIILESNGVVKFNEGCLSIPNRYAFIPRFQWIKISALNFYGKKFELEAENLLSVCIQHEIDHLKGKLFIDYPIYINNE